MNRFTLPIQVAGLAAARERISKAESDYGYFELWVDYLEQPRAEELAVLADDFPERIIFVFRRTQLEKPKLAASQRRVFLTQLAACPVVVDLDISTQQTELEHYRGLNRHGLLIVSFHDYHKTPDTLEPIIEKMVEFQPDIFKVATVCHNKYDVLKLLQLKIKLDGRGSKNIILGMGPAGKVARIVCGLWGNEFIFAPDSTSPASAPGQLTRQQLLTIDGIVNQETE